jgi:hypothetical protein
MDERLPLGSLSAPTLLTLLEQERARTAELEQEVARLQAGLARQNALILELQQRDAARERELAEMRTLISALTEQNTLLRQQVAALQQENAQLRGEPRARAPEPALEVKPATPRREAKVRKQRDPKHNAGRRRLDCANRWETHAVEQCPRCGMPLQDGWIHRRVQVIDLPAPAPLEVTEHRMIRRQCSRCGLRCLPPPVGLEAGRIGRSCFGPRLMAAIATMATVERLPGRVICDRLRREYGLVLSHGGLQGLLARIAAAGEPTYAALRETIRTSAVVHADETGWRENGQHTTVWTTCTARTVYVHHGRRTNEEIDGILGADFGGTLVTDFYAAYHHFLGAKQRCWAHLVRELEALLHVDTAETGAWAEGILWIYAQASIPRPPPEEGWTPHAVRAREARAQQCEALILLLCPADLDPALPYTTLATRLRTHVSELFTFVRDPQVEATNNRAERSLRPLVIARKVSGGTRSATGSRIRMTLYSIAATARLQHQDPTAIFQQIVRAPATAPSLLATPTAPC